jgi:hypothetical protein
MYKDIVIIGLGSLGGFFAESVSRMKGLQNLMLIDPDIVEMKNVGKSIYRRNDVGEKKVFALKRIIENNNDSLNIICHPIEYHENKMCLPYSDLTVDCRDIICNRNGDIDIRMYISFRTLVMDCKRNFRVITQRPGRYIQYLNMGELSVAASTAFHIINSGKVNDLIKNQMIHQISMDYQASEISKAIKLYNERPDMIIDSFSGDERIRNLHEMLPMIIDSNKSKDLTVIVGQENCIGDKIKKIKKCEMIELSSAVKVLSEIIQSLPLHSEYYTIVINKEKNEWFIELLPETGAA